MCWISLDGSVPVSPRQDRFPYLRVDGIVKSYVVEVHDGDMRQEGGESGCRVCSWSLAYLTATRVEQALEVADRAA